MLRLHPAFTRPWAGAAALAVALVVLGAFPTAGPATFRGVNGRLAFESTRDGNPEIYVMGVDGSAQTRLTTSTGFDEAPTWSPDGRHIAFGAASGYVALMNPDGSGQAPLNTPAEGNEPGWSPVGRRIAFVSYRDGNPEIYVMNADGTGQTRLTTNSAVDEDVVWSPDGTELAFESDRGGLGTQIFVMDPDGTRQRPLTTIVSGDPDWSPDGSTIAFEGPDGIYVMNRDGSARRRLSGIGEGPAWSPDGKLIAFEVPLSGIYVMAADGTHRHLVATSAGRPDWQPLPSLALDVKTFRLRSDGSVGEPGAYVGAGGGLHYRITVTNTSDTDLSGVVMTDALPAETRIVIGMPAADHGSCTHSSEVVSCALDALAAHEAAMISFEVNVLVRNPDGSARPPGDFSNVFGVVADQQPLPSEVTVRTAIVLPDAGDINDFVDSVVVPCLGATTPFGDAAEMSFILLDELALQEKLVAAGQAVSEAALSAVVDELLKLAGLPFRRIVDVAKCAAGIRSFYNRP